MNDDPLLLNKAMEFILGVDKASGPDLGTAFLTLGKSSFFAEFEKSSNISYYCRHHVPLLNTEGSLGLLHTSFFDEPPHAGDVADEPAETVIQKREWQNHGF